MVEHEIRSRRRGLGARPGSVKTFFFTSFLLSVIRIETPDYRTPVGELFNENTGDMATWKHLGHSCVANRPQCLHSGRYTLLR